MVRTRFAPSPTGYLHIGGVRTALFNWLFARHHGGRFILRIDDTDVRRNLDEALQPILDGFRWLGIDWDEGPEVDGECGPYFQSQRLDRYQAAVQTLLEKELAYRDYARPEEIQTEREAAQREKRPFVYSRRWMAQSADQQREFEAEGRSGVVRLKMPREGQCNFDDHIRGPMAVQWSGEQDHVVQRADGTCLYHLASVVDDHDMQITHVIRAEEHLSNTPRQIFIARGLGYELPEYAHVPFVAEPGSKNKLSKRKLDKYLKNPDFAKLNEHGKRIADRIGLETAADSFNPVIVDFYRQVGFLPDALVNYLLLLGWSLDDKTEFFTREEMIEHFSLERVNNSPASFDPGKLVAFQDRYMQQLPIKQKVAMVLPFLERAGLAKYAYPTAESIAGAQLNISRTDAERNEAVDSQRIKDWAHVVLETAGDRLKVLGDIVSVYKQFWFVGDVEYDKNAVQKRLVEPSLAAELLKRFRDDLTKAHTFQAERLEAIMRDFVGREGIRTADIIHAVRVAITGQTIGPPLFECLSVIGRDKCLARLNMGIMLARRGGTPDQPIFYKYHHQRANDELQLYQGELEIDGQLADGTISLKWVPSPRITFQLETDANVQVGPCSLKLANEDTSCPGAFASRVQYSSSARTVVAGMAQPLTRGRCSMMQEATFTISNFHDYLGNGIGTVTASGLNTWAGRVHFQGGGWAITLDGLRKLRARVEEASSTGGYILTHVGRIQRTDSQKFGTDALGKLVSVLQHFLSFARGLYVAPLLLVGNGSDASACWEEWDAGRILDRWRLVRSWFPILHPECLDAFFPAFLDRWMDGSWQGVITDILYWYLTGNTSRAVETTIVDSQIALETLANALVGHDELAMAHTSERLIRLLLQHLGITTGVPKHLQNASKFAQKIGASDGPAVLVRLRDAIVHPTREGRATSDQATKLDAKYQIRELGQWYIEVCLLRLFEYKGPYHNRLKTGYTTDSEPFTFGESGPAA